MGDNEQMSVEKDAGNGAAVLVVEDSENSACTLEIAFAGIAGISVLVAPNALEAWRLLKNPGRPFEAVVTDLNMPRMDGFELIRRVREQRELAGTPIVVVSADTDPETPGRVARMGVSAFFPKPYSPGEIRRKVEQILNGTGG
jgi:two-component system chemotaxis response regulator CheY